MNVVITGTTSGIGKVIAQNLDQHSITSINRTDIDLSQSQDFSHIDLSNQQVLILNAGVLYGIRDQFKSYTVEQITKVLYTNFFNNVLLTKKFIDQNPNGHIIYIGSMATTRFINVDPMYALSKHCLKAFFDIIKNCKDTKEFKITAIHPGRTKTNMHRHMSNYVYASDTLSAHTVAKHVVYAIEHPEIKDIQINA